MHVGVGHLNIAQMQPAQPQEGQEQRLAGEGLARQGLHPDELRLLRLAAAGLGLLFPDQIPEPAIAQRSLGAGVENGADRRAVQVGVNDGQLPMAPPRGHHDHAPGFVLVGAGPGDLHLPGFEIQGQALALEPVHAQHAIDLHALDRQGGRPDLASVTRAHLQQVEQHDRPGPDTHHGVDLNLLCGLEVQPLGQSPRHTADVGAGIQQETEGALTVDPDRRHHVVVAALAGGKAGRRLIGVRQLRLRGLDNHIGQRAGGREGDRAPGQQTQHGVTTGGRHVSRSSISSLRQR